MRDHFFSELYSIVICSVQGSQFCRRLSLWLFCI